jgi:hypothetical protein
MGARNEVPGDCLPPISGSLVDFADVVSLSDADAIRNRTNSEDILDSFMISKEVLELRKKRGAVFWASSTHQSIYFRAPVGCLRDFGFLALSHCMPMKSLRATLKRMP